MRKCIAVFLALGLLAPLPSILPVLAVPRASSSAWYMFPAQESSRDTIDYAELTELCLAAGLSENPYPSPTVPERVIVPPMIYVYGDSSYHVFTLTIGDKVFEGISCDVYDLDWNLATKIVHMAYQATWYLGKLGQMNHGFTGNIDLTFYGFVRNADGSESWDYFVISYAMEGFGRFNKQSVVLTGDTRVNPDIAGYCLVLGNRY